MKVHDDYSKTYVIDDGVSIFKDQFEWIEFLFTNVERFGDVTFVVRPDPRVMNSWPEKLEWLREYQYKKDRFIVYDSNEITSDQLLTLSDLILISSSSFEIDALKRGLPVMSIYPNNAAIAIPLELKRAQNKEEYISEVKRILESELSVNDYKNLATSHGILLHGKVSVFYDNGGFWQNNCSKSDDSG